MYTWERRGGAGQQCQIYPTDIPTTTPVTPGPTSLNSPAPSAPKAYLPEQPCP